METSLSARKSSPYLTNSLEISNSIMKVGKVESVTWRGAQRKDDINLSN